MLILLINKNVANFLFLVYKEPRNVINGIFPVFIYFPLYALFRLYRVETYSYSRSMASYFATLNIWECTLQLSYSQSYAN